MELKGTFCLLSFRAITSSFGLSKSAVSLIPAAGLISRSSCIYCNRVECVT